MSELVCNCCGGEINTDGIKWSYEFNQLIVDGVVVKFTPSEADLFEVLYSRFGKVVELGKLYAKLFGSYGDDVDESKHVMVYICHIRKKLKVTRFSITNVNGIGYYLALNEGVSK